MSVHHVGSRVGSGRQGGERGRLGRGKGVGRVVKGFGWDAEKGSAGWRKGSDGTRNRTQRPEPTVSQCS